MLNVPPGHMAVKAQIVLRSGLLPQLTALRVAERDGGHSRELCHGRASDAARTHLASRRLALAVYALRRIVTRARPDVQLAV